MEALSLTIGKGRAREEKKRESLEREKLSKEKRKKREKMYEFPRIPLNDYVAKFWPHGHVDAFPEMVIEKRF